MYFKKGYLCDSRYRDRNVLEEVSLKFCEGEMKGRGKDTAFVAKGSDSMIQIWDITFFP